MTRNKNVYQQIPPNLSVT